jgi:hypothetical protein
VGLVCPHAYDSNARRSVFSATEESVCPLRFPAYASRGLPALLCDEILFDSGRVPVCANCLASFQYVALLLSGKAVRLTIYEFCC